MAAPGFCMAVGSLAAPGFSMTVGSQLNGVGEHCLLLFTCPSKKSETKVVKISTFISSFVTFTPHYDKVSISNRSCSLGNAFSGKNFW
jgi:hypothetical protein